MPGQSNEKQLVGKTGTKRLTISLSCCLQNVCHPITSRTMRWLRADAQVTALVKKVPECPAFDTGCCAFHVTQDILQILRSDIEFICSGNLTQLVDANINQLKTTLEERAALYTCDDKKLSPEDRSGVQGLETAQKTMFLWRVLEKYENSARMSPSAEM